MPKKKTIKQSLFGGLVKKIMILPWVPFVISFLLLLPAIIIAQIIIMGIWQPDTVITYESMLKGLIITFVSSFTVASLIKINVAASLRKKLKKIGLL